MPPTEPDRSNVVNLDRRARKKRRPVPAIVVAGVVLVVIVLTFLVVDTLRETTPQWRERVSTASNQHSTVYLPDGSFMAVNGNTELLAEVFPRRREIALTRGEVWLQVSYQYLSTFSVKTGTEGVDIVPASDSTPDLAFNVRYVPGTELAVQVERGPVRVRTRTAGTRDFIELKTGEAIKVDLEMRRHSIGPVDPDHVGAWRG
ncbi:hypothetical protein CEK29_03350 [Bordetella genomosp. 5]|uniref:FecR protein domain-containing protein n=1 Tax=Bordetella genomosp. 5 TaxID=1395608 RepID=A0A261TBI5_9BORD|nr:FecR domain-containing protein [Bordetella genomosp. 5]OZI46949.1 hypothetical protein CAL25_20020 [Bordetella genomosp. 5]OZI47763.1 hypothetical protein CEK29_03350 [Bordetella genomosp. 5]